MPNSILLCRLPSCTCGKTIFPFCLEFLDCFNTPPKAATTMTAVNPSLPNNGTNASSGSHHPTTLHQTSNDSSVTSESIPVFSIPSSCIVPVCIGILV